MSGAPARYHVSFYDSASGESLGLLLTENGGAIGRVAQLASPWAAKVGSGDRTLSDLTDLSTYEQTDWSGGRGHTVTGLDGPGRASDHAPIVAEFW